MNADVETILSALLSFLQARITVSLTGDVAAGSATIANLSTTSNLSSGLPFVGAGIPEGAMIDSVDATTNSLVLSAPATANGTGVPLTSGFLTIGRRVQHWNQVASQPALFIRHTGDDDQYDQSVVPKTVINAEIWIYSRAGANPDLSPDIGLNNLVKAVKTALAPDVRGFPQTLNGLVQWVRIEGHSDYDPGDLDAQSKATLPVRILCP